MDRLPLTCAGTKARPGAWLRPGIAKANKGMTAKPLPPLASYQDIYFSQDNDFALTHSRCRAAQLLIDSSFQLSTFRKHWGSLAKNFTLTGISMNTHTTTTEVTAFDPEELRTKLDRHGDFEHVQLSAGPFRGRFMRSHFGDGILNMGTYSRDVLVRGSYPEDRITLGLILSAREAGYFNGRRLGVNDMIVIAEGGAMEPYRLPAGTQRVVFQISRDRLEREGVDIPERSEIVFHSRLSPEVLQLNQLVTAFTKPQIGSDRREYRDALVSEDDLIAGFRRAIDASAGRNNRVHSLYSEKRSRILRNLEELIESHLTSDIRIPDLCAHLGISQRTLEYFCNDYYGMSPRHYVTVRRLNAVRRQLLHAAGTKLTIAATAHSFGFMHLGRFAAMYRSKFGELPSQTLRNR